MNKVIGVFAHVDAGKTTLSEQLLYRAGALRTPGRVDEKTSVLDAAEVERQRGITVFSGQARFTFGESTYYLLDTPGHTDFSAEMERALRIIDFAVLVVSCAEGIQAHTETIWRMLRGAGAPVFVFLNKTDRAGADPDRVYAELRKRFSPDIVDMDAGFTPEVLTALAERDDAFLETYLDGAPDEAAAQAAARRLVCKGRLFPCLRGAALRGEGVDKLLQALDRLSETRYDINAPFGGTVYRAAHDGKGNRIVFFKALCGAVRVRDSLSGEKIQELRLYQADRYEQVPRIEAGMLCGAVGLDGVRPGAGIGPRGQSITCESTPALTFGVTAENADLYALYEALQTLENEDPALGVTRADGRLRIQCMGPVQTEILQQAIWERFGIRAEFGDCRVSYRETIAAPIIGYGHYEPLRHYAEVHLLLEPGARGSGITFDSALSTDALDQSIQRQIEQVVLEHDHRGVLTGARLTDVRVTLLYGKNHLKHTSGGDFREAVRRAVRQGLEQAECLLLEPVYDFRADLPAVNLGRLMADIQKFSGTFSPPISEGERAVLTGRAPVSELMRYQSEVQAYTRGAGYISLRFGGYEPCHDADAVIGASGYARAADSENPSESIFCAHGAGFAVQWFDIHKFIPPYKQIPATLYTKEDKTI